jgi:hypothetical protein
MPTAVVLLACFVGVDDKEGKIDAAGLAALKKKLAVKIAFDRKTGIVQLVYDFRSPKQGADFLIDGKPADVKSGLVLKPSAVAEHVVAWKTVAIEAKVQITKFGGAVIHAPLPNISVSLAGANFDAVYLEFADRSKPSIIPAAERTGLKTLRLELNEDSSLAAHSIYQVSEKTKFDSVGKIDFRGGNYGYGFRMISFRGRPDPTWLKELTDQK